MDDYTKLFIDELRALLKKYNVTITADDHYQGYAECGQDIQVTFEFNYPHENIKIGQYFKHDSEI